METSELSGLRTPFLIWAEYLSAKVRRLTNAGAGPIDPYRVAKLFQISICLPADVPGVPEASLATISKLSNNVSWYTITLYAESRTVIVVNSSLSPEEEYHALLLELSHRLMAHVGSTKHRAAERLWFIARYTNLQLAQAAWLANCLKVSRKSIMPSASVSTMAVAQFDPMNALRRKVKLRPASVPMSVRQVGPISNILDD